jgi:hypothetical protein
MILICFDPITNLHDDTIGLNVALKTNKFASRTPQNRVESMDAAYEIELGGNREGSFCLS